MRGQKRPLTDRKSLLALRALARSLKPKACISMGAESQKWAGKSKTGAAGWGAAEQGCERQIERYAELKFSKVIMRERVKPAALDYLLLVFP